jgi:hypothetical protein
MLVRITHTLHRSRDDAQQALEQLRAAGKIKPRHEARVEHAYTPLIGEACWTITVLSVWNKRRKSYLIS